MSLKSITAVLLLTISAVQTASSSDLSDVGQKVSEGTPLTQPAPLLLNTQIQLIVTQTEELSKQTDSSVLTSKAFDLVAASATPYKGKLPTDINSLEKNLLTKSLYQLIKYLQSHKALEKKGVEAFIQAMSEKAETEQQDYLTYLTTVLLGAYENASTLTYFKAGKRPFIADKFPVWLKDKLKHDINWEYLENYSQNLYMTEMSHELSQTTEPTKAYEISHKLGEYLKDAVDFSNFPLTLSAEDFAKQTLVALIRQEKYKMFETEHGHLKTIDPSISDYYTSTASNVKSQAVMLCLVNVIQNHLYNSQTTVVDLLTLLGYQKNSRYLSPAVKSAIENLFEEGTIHRLINENLIRQIQQSALAITSIQKAALDRESKKQQLLTYDLPVLSLAKDSQVLKSAQMFYFGSSGSGLQCGFFSLGLPSRQHAIGQILDNLSEKEVFLLADKVSAESSEIRVALKKYITEHKETASSTRYLELYTKNKSKDAKEAEVQAELKKEYQQLAKTISEQETLIDEEFDRFKKQKGLPLKVPDNDDGTISSQFSTLKKPFNYRKWMEQTQFTKLIYPLVDFQNHIEKDIRKKFAGGELEFDPNPEWKSDVFTYPKITAVLNNYDIYCWVSAWTFAMMQMQQGGYLTDPIHYTSDRKLILINFISGGPTAKRIDILNMGGGHFEKLVSADDHPRLARSIRHKTLYHLSNTNS